MNKYDLSDKDYSNIYEDATRTFTSADMNYKEKYGHFLVRCIVQSFIGLTKSKNIMVKDGELIQNEENL